MTTDLGKSPVVLSGKYMKFVEAFIDDSNKLTYLNQTQSTIAAGYAEASARVQGCRLMKNADILHEINKRLKERRDQLTEVFVQRVVRERERLAFFDPRKLYNEDGSLKRITDLDDDTAAAIQSFEIHVVEPQYKMKYGDAEHDQASEAANSIAAKGGTVLKIKHYDKDKSLTAFERQLGMYKDNAPPPQSPLSIHIHLDPK